MRKEIVAPFENKTQGRKKTLGAYLEKITTLSFFSSKKSVTCYKNKVMPYLIPAFLRRLDHYLLIRCPLLWVSKVHYVLFYSLLALSLGGLLIYFYPLTPASYLPTYEEILLVGALLVLPVAIYWVYLQVIYKVSATYFHFFAQARFALHFLCFSLFVFLPFAFSAMVNEKVANLVSDEEWVENLDAFNIGSFYFPVDSSNFRATYGGYFRCIYPENLRYSYRKTNNFFKINDSLKYNIAFSIKTHDEIFKLKMGVKQRNEELLIIKDFIHTYNKFNVLNLRYSPQSILMNYKNKKILNHINEYSIRKIEHQMDKVLKAKLQLFFTDSNKLITLFLISFCPSLLLSLYRII